MPRGLEGSQITKKQGGNPLGGFAGALDLEKKAAFPWGRVKPDYFFAIPFRPTQGRFIFRTGGGNRPRTGGGNTNFSKSSSWCLPDYY